MPHLCSPGQAEFLQVALSRSLHTVSWCGVSRRLLYTPGNKTFIISLPIPDMIFLVSPLLIKYYAISLKHTQIIRLTNYSHKITTLRVLLWKISFVFSVKLFLAYFFIVLQSENLTATCRWMLTDMNIKHCLASFHTLGGGGVHSDEEISHTFCFSNLNEAGWYAGIDQL